jgi:hypothetical protein
MVMNPDVQMLEQLREAGVSLKDAHWYHAVARPRRFSRPGDPERARAILRQLYGARRNRTVLDQCQCTSQKH